MRGQAAWALLALASCGAAQAAGPYFHAGNGGIGDWSRWHYPAVNDSQTQQISFQLFTQFAAGDTDMHMASACAAVPPSCHALPAACRAWPAPWDAASSSATSRTA